LWRSVWEIWQVLVSYKNTWDYKEELKDLLQVKYSLVREWYFSNFVFKRWDEEKKQIFKSIINNLVENKYYIIWEWDYNVFELIKELVDKDIWFYDTKTMKITANSKSLEIAFKRLLKELKK
jgi:hypothetical protein